MLPLILFRKDMSDACRFITSVSLLYSCQTNIVGIHMVQDTLMCHMIKAQLRHLICTNHLSLLPCLIHGSNTQIFFSSVMIIILLYNNHISQSQKLFKHVSFIAYFLLFVIFYFPSLSKCFRDQLYL